MILVLVAVLVVLAVACISGLAVVAIPAFTSYVLRSKTAEARTQLVTLYQGAAAYYAQEHVGPNGETLSQCVVDSARTGNEPRREGTTLSLPLDPSFEALGFEPYGPVRYRYEVVSVGGCGHGADAALYSFRAVGDLDEDGVTSLFELSAGSGPDQLLFRSPGIRVENELE